MTAMEPAPCGCPRFEGTTAQDGVLVPYAEVGHTDECRATQARAHAKAEQAEARALAAEQEARADRDAMLDWLAGLSPAERTRLVAARKGGKENDDGK